MSNSEKLKKFLIQEMIPNLEEAIDEMFFIIEKAKNRVLVDKELPLNIKEGRPILLRPESFINKESLQNLQEIHADCKDILTKIEAGKMDEDEAGDILRFLMSIKI